ncbi:MAG: Adenine phosphoribosyltransferase [candidate division TA06 bacterium ADurb.Bin417]|uniref:Adenine phosphoribosyltransferase n=1 Tax=candidate division TA06 bacterium ADurb.Bin417 TaxID=1852828 RepID=A0A1V5MJU7_UNCT6|nr:MAG: Adenine phosphoribosyltransferase [candidate division TA06 bacterium ADurb.Bin417]
MDEKRIKEFIRSIPDFPKPGILFRDITPLLAEPDVFRDVLKQLADACPLETEVVAGIESRGFIFGAAVAARLGKGFVPIRKPGKLPYLTTSVSYQLEYGTDTLEIHQDALADRRRVVLVDDLLATGGTAAAAHLFQQLAKVGGQVLKALFLVELRDLDGRARLAGRTVEALVGF